MPVVTRKSTAVTAGDALPQTMTSQKINGGRLRERIGVIESVAIDLADSVYRMVRVSSGDRISRVLLSSDASTSAAVNIGVYDIPSVNAGGAVNAAFFASAVVLTTAMVNQDVTHEADAADASTGFGLADIEKPLWQALGLASDPGKQYDIALTLTVDVAIAGTIGLKVLYVDGN